MLPQNPYSKIIHYEIPGVALFESRRFEKQIQQTFIFIRKNHLLTIYNEDYKEIRNTYSPILPVLPEENLHNIYLEISYCRLVINVDKYCILLTDLLEGCSSYDEVNILFYYIRKQEVFTDETINKIVNMGLQRKTIRNSFEAQKYMIDIVFYNKHLLESDAYHSVLSKFPHASRKGLPWIESSKLL